MTAVVFSHHLSKQGFINVLHVKRKQLQVYIATVLLLKSYELLDVLHINANCSSKCRASISFVNRHHCDNKVQFYLFILLNCQTVLLSIILINAKINIILIE